MDYYLCDLFTKSGAKITLESTHYVGLANFKDRAETYSPFIVWLHTQLPKEVEYIKGQSWFGFIFMILALVTLILVSLILGIANLFTIIWIGVIFLLVTVFSVFRLVKNIKKNKPGTYDLNNIPLNLLPS